MNSHEQSQPQLHWNSAVKAYPAQDEADFKCVEKVTALQQRLNTIGQVLSDLGIPSSS